MSVILVIGDDQITTLMLETLSYHPSPHMNNICYSTFSQFPQDIPDDVMSINNNYRGFVT